MIGAEKTTLVEKDLRVFHKYQVMIAVYIAAFILQYI